MGRNKQQRRTRNRLRHYRSRTRVEAAHNHNCICRICLLVVWPCALCDNVVWFCCCCFWLFSVVAFCFSVSSAGHMATLFLPRGAITVQVTSWHFLPDGYLTQVEERDRLNLRGVTVGCATKDDTFTGTRQSSVPKPMNPRNGENTICRPEIIFDIIKQRWNIDLTK